MIRTVADRLIARTRPAYVGRHRRDRPRLTALRRVATADREPDGHRPYDRSSASGR